MAFFALPTFAQHPLYAVPTASFPQYGRVGVYPPPGGGESGAKRLMKRDLVIRARADLADQIIREDNEILEILIPAVTSGKLDE